MQEMLTRWGFTTVWDLGSDPGELLPLRQRVEAGDVLGPRIFSAGSIFPKGGHPIYLPPEMQLPEAATADAAIGIARNFLAQGLDGMKLFTGSYMGERPVVNMDATIAKAVVETAHARGKRVFAHPQNRTGVDVVIAANIDVLAHTVPSEPGYTSEQLAQFKAQGIALIPTLSLWTTVVGDQAAKDYLVQSGVNQLKAFAANGGVILFGTDVGFTKLYDTSPELEFMGVAALDAVRAGPKLFLFLFSEPHRGPSLNRLPKQRQVACVVNLVLEVHDLARDIGGNLADVDLGYLARPGRDDFALHDGVLVVAPQAFEELLAAGRLAGGRIGPARRDSVFGTRQMEKRHHSGPHTPPSLQRARRIARQQYPNNMPQVITVTDAQGRWAVYVPLRVGGQIVVPEPVAH